VSAASFERKFGVAKNQQTCGVGERRRGVVGEPGKRASQRQTTRARIEKIKLHRDLKGALRMGAERPQQNRARDRRPAGPSRSLRAH
jgi:hypothetical protein